MLHSSVNGKDDGGDNNGDLPKLINLRNCRRQQMNSKINKDEVKAELSSTGVLAIASSASVHFAAKHL